jgi:hypothetical protein
LGDFGFGFWILDWEIGDWDLGFGILGLGFGSWDFGEVIDFLPGEV